MSWMTLGSEIELLRRLLILQGISQQVVQISSSLKSRLSSTLIRGALRKLGQGRFGG